MDLKAGHDNSYTVNMIHHATKLRTQILVISTTQLKDESMTTLMACADIASNLLTEFKGEKIEEDLTEVRLRDTQLCNLMKYRAVEMRAELCGLDA